MSLFDRHHDKLPRRKILKSKTIRKKQTSKKPVLDDQTQRNLSLLAELRQEGRKTSFVDNRLKKKGYSSAVSGQNETIRLQKLYAKKRKLATQSLKSIENNNDDLVITHKGLPITSFQDGSSLNDVDLIDSSGETDLEDNDNLIPAEAHFGGGDQLDHTEDKGPERTKTRQEVYDEIISKSKKAKAQRVREHQQQELELGLLDDAYRDLRHNLEMQPTKWSLEGIAAASKADAENINDDINDFERLLKSLAFDKRARPTDRVKTQAELAQEKAERLKLLEDERLCLQQRLEMEESKEQEADEVESDFHEIEDDTENETDNYETEDTSQHDGDDESECEAIQETESKENDESEEDEENDESEDEDESLNESEVAYKNEESSDENQTRSENENNGKDAMNETQKKKVNRETTYLMNAHKETSTDFSSNFDATTPIKRSDQSESKTGLGCNSSKISNLMNSTTSISGNSAYQNDLKVTSVSNEETNDRSAPPPWAVNEASDGDLPFHYDFPTNAESLSRLLRRLPVRSQWKVLWRLRVANDPHINVENHKHLEALAEYLLSFMHNSITAALVENNEDFQLTNFLNILSEHVTELLFEYPKVIVKFFVPHLLNTCKNSFPSMETHLDHLFSKLNFLSEEITSKNDLKNFHPHCAANDLALVYVGSTVFFCKNPFDSTLKHPIASVLSMLLEHWGEMILHSNKKSLLSVNSTLDNEGQKNGVALEEQQMLLSQEDLKIAIHLICLQKRMISKYAYSSTFIQLIIRSLASLYVTHFKDDDASNLKTADAITSLSSILQQSFTHLLSQTELKSIDVLIKHIIIPTIENLLNTYPGHSLISQLHTLQSFFFNILHEPLCRLHLAPKVPEGIRMLTPRYVDPRQGFRWLQTKGSSNDKQSEARKLKREYNETRRGTARQLRKDAEFLASVQAKEKRKHDSTSAANYKRMVTVLNKEQEDIHKLRTSVLGGERRKKTKKN